MAFWLFKSESGAWSWDDHVRAGVSEWDGVRNHQANNYMKAMKLGERGFFYHSGDERRIVGVVKIVKEWHLDPGDESGRFGMVELEALEPVADPVSLADIKANAKLQDLLLVRHSRLSVSPVGDDEWRTICAMAGIEPQQ